MKRAALFAAGLLCGAALALVAGMREWLFDY